MQPAEKSDVYDITDERFVKDLFMYLIDEAIELCSKGDSANDTDEELRFLAFYVGGVLTGQLAEFRPMDKRKTDKVVQRLKAEMETYPILENFHGASDDDVDWAMSAPLYVIRDLMHCLAELADGGIDPEAFKAKTDALIDYWTGIVCGKAAL